MPINKYDLYEEAVQTPQVHVEWFSNIYKDVRNKSAYTLREDFCGTFQLSCYWVKQGPRHTALGIDLDPEPLDYGKKNNLSKLSAPQKKRIVLKKANVLVPTVPKKDLIIAGNFSFFIFKQRELLLKYFKTCLKSLNQDGIMILEVAGGPGMISTGREQKAVPNKKKKKFTYVWDQKSFDPITHDALYAIHFKMQDGTKMNNAFTYDWRLWTIPEIKDVLADAGFKDSCVYWETSHLGDGTGEYARCESGDNAHAWIAYVVGIK
jgi:hypothetical protein